MRALPLLLIVPVLMWASQTVLAWRAGVAWSWRIGAVELPRGARVINRAATNLAFAAVLLLYPLLRGMSPMAYYADYLPTQTLLPHAAWGAAAASLYLLLLYLAWALTDNVRFELRHPLGKLLRRLAGAPLTAVFAALVEELLFRAMLLADLLETCPRVMAVMVGVVVFAGAHYVRSVKRYWTFPGHLALGTLFCLAFVCTGSIWLAFGLHAGGVLVLMSLRPMIRYVGPAWLVGASIFPYAGVVGVAALVLLTINVLVAFGGGL